MPLGPNVNGFEKDLEDFVNEISPCAALSRDDKAEEDKDLSRKVVCFSGGPSSFLPFSRKALIFLGVPSMIKPENKEGCRNYVKDL